MKALSITVHLLFLILTGCVVLLSTAQDLLAQSVNVSASINDSTIGTEEALVYTISIDGSTGETIPRPRAPQADGLKILQSSPSTQSSVSIINGAVSRGYSFSWTYQPNKAGTARIGSTTVTVAGKTYRTNEITVTIVPQSQRPQQRRGASQRRLDPFSSLFSAPGRAAEREPASIRDTDIFIRAVPSRTHVVQNEQVTIEYQLFFREGIQLRQSRLTNSWDAEGFWREELDVETRPIPEIVVENGLRYNKIVLKRAAVFPTRAGKLSVDSLRIESEALLPSPSRDPFQQLFSMRNRFQAVELGSKAVQIESVPLPDSAPPSFSGAVGSYSFKTGIDRTTIKVGESIKYTVTISGSGNLATLATPVFSAPTSFELYDPQVTLNLNRAGRNLSGSKSFSYILVARANGTFELPPVEFTWFNPRSNRYSSDRSDPVFIVVTGSASTPASITATSNGLPVDDVAPPFDRAGKWHSLRPTSYHTMAWPYLALLIPLILIGVVFAAQRHQNKLAGDISYARNRKAHPLARKHLKKARSLMDRGDPIAFFAELEHAVLGFVGNRLNVSERGLTRQQLDISLSEASVSETVREHLNQLLDTCDRGRFAPVNFGPTELQAANEDASALIVAISAILDERK